MNLETDFYGIDYVCFKVNNPYQYGMNTQEKDVEINKNVYTAQFWEYDSRIGRRWNLDPKPQISISDYSCFGNNPIKNVDVFGDDWWVLNDGSLLNLQGISELPNEYSEKNATRIGGDNFFGKNTVMQKVTIMDTKISQEFAKSHGYKVVATQTLENENISTYDVPTGKKSISYETGTNTIINEKYDVVKEDYISENTKSETLSFEYKSNLIEQIGGTKRTETISRQYYKYEKEQISHKVANIISKVFNFINATTGKHKDVVPLTYESWNSYKENISINKGKLTKYEK